MRMRPNKANDRSAQAAAIDPLQSLSSPSAHCAATAGYQTLSGHVSSPTPLPADQGPQSPSAAPTTAPVRADPQADSPVNEVSVLTEVCSNKSQHLPHAEQAAAAAGDDTFSDAMATSITPPVKRLPSTRRKKVVSLRQVLQQSGDYHCFNRLFTSCILALAVTMVLYWHWGTFTAIFKVSVQESFHSYGPEWQSQSMQGVKTMSDAVAYSMGWLEFWLRRADEIGLPGRTVRAQDYGDILYARVLVNLDRNCDALLSPHLSCYKDDAIYEGMLMGSYGTYNHNHLRSYASSGFYENAPGYANLLEWAGWVNVFRQSSKVSAVPFTSDHWWAYSIIAPRYYGTEATRDVYIGRLYNITRGTSLNVNDCDWLATNCSADNPCASEDVPFSNWFCAIDGAENSSVRMLSGPGIQYGRRTFVRDPTSDPSVLGVLDLKAYLAKYAYSIIIEVVAANTLGDNYHGSMTAAYGPNRDLALFSLIFQRSAEASGIPDRVMWQTSTTVPVRTSFYTSRTDMYRICLEVLLLICVSVLVFSQVQQWRICRVQCGSWRPFCAHFWNAYEIISTSLLLAWMIFYIALLLISILSKQSWRLEEWDVYTTQDGADHQIVNPQEYLERLSLSSDVYAAWLYMGIVVDFLVLARLARWTRVHVGLMAFQQVFIIAGRETMDFVVYFLFILVTLSATIFAFFQLTGGNNLFLRFSDALAAMTRLTFGFLGYEEFQAQALGVGPAVSAVTVLFWLAVVLLVVFSQNIILAIVANAYAEAKSKLGAADTSFIVLFIMRLVFSILFICYHAMMICGKLCWLFTSNQQLMPPQQSGIYSQPKRPVHRGAGCGRSGASSGRPGPPGVGISGDQTLAGRVSAVETDTASRGDQQDPTNRVPASGRRPSLLPAYKASGALPEDLESGTQPGPGFLVTASAPSSTPRSTVVAGDAGRSVPLHSWRSRGPTSAVNGLPADPCRAGLHEPNSSFGQRLKLMWHGIVRDKHGFCMYRQVSGTPQKSDKRWIAAWKSHYWSPWCVARCTAVKGLMSLYLDFSTYELKDECTWPQARHVFSMAANESAVRGDAAITPGLPLLTSCVDEDTLSRLFTVVIEMNHTMPIRCRPFPALTEQSVTNLVQGVFKVYGLYEDEVLAVLAHEGLKAEQDSVGNGSDQGGSSWGQVPPRGGFFTQLSVKRREGCTESWEATSLLHADRRLEEAAHRTNHNLDLCRADLSQVMQQTHTTLEQLDKQQGQQNNIIEAIRELQATMQSLAASQQHVLQVLAAQQQQ